VTNTDETAADALAAADDDGASAVAMDGSAARNGHEPRRAGIPAGAVRQPPWEWRRLLLQSTRPPRKIFAYVLHEKYEQIGASAVHHPALYLARDFTPRRVS
jgi:hypothetical protein